MTAILYAKHPFCDIFDEVSRGYNFDSINDAIIHAQNTNNTNVHTTYKITMVETNESKIFSKNVR